jgi:hypothetical protein
MDKLARRSFFGALAGLAAVPFMKQSEGLVNPDEFLIRTTGQLRIEDCVFNDGLRIQTHEGQNVLFCRCRFYNSISIDI